MLLSPRCNGAVLNPSRGKFTIDFEHLAAGVCLFSEGIPLAREFSASSITFAGPGFGGMNGGVPLDVCTLASGLYPPLGNHSVAGDGFLGFSELHTFVGGRTGKALAPETIRFDSRMTNIHASFAAIDGHAVRVELWSGPASSFDDHGVLLRSMQLAATDKLQQFQLADENDIFVDCVRRMVVSSSAKMFVLDDLQYSLSAATDALCPNDPAVAPTATAQQEQASSSAVGRGRRAFFLASLFVAGLAALTTSWPK